MGSAPSQERARDRFRVAPLRFADLAAWRRALPFAAVLCLAASAHALDPSWLGLAAFAALGSGALLALAGVVALARAPVAVERGEPRRAARLWLALSAAWSAGLGWASVFPGAFEHGWLLLFLFLGLPLGLGWLIVLLRLLCARLARPADAPAFAPRTTAERWLMASACFAALGTVVSARELLGQGMQFLMMLFLCNLLVMAAFFLVYLLARELPEHVRDVPPRAARRGALYLVRFATFVPALALCGCAPSLDGFPPGFALLLGGLGCLGVARALLEALVRELPHAARSLWLAALGALLVLTAGALVTAGVPRRALFELYRARFDACVAEGTDGARSLGPWQGHFVHDGGGGAYFGTWSSQQDSDGVLHMGFALHPATDGPYGHVIELQPLGGDWFQFQAWSR